MLGRQELGSFREQYGYEQVRALSAKKRIFKKCLNKRKYYKENKEYKPKT